MIIPSICVGIPRWTLGREHKHRRTIFKKPAIALRPTDYLGLYWWVEQVRDTASGSFSSTKPAPISELQIFLSAANAHWRFVSSSLLVAQRHYAQEVAQSFR